MLGKPKFSQDATVQFRVGKEKKIGVITAVDHLGAFEYDQEITYDVRVETEQKLYRRVPEHNLKKCAPARLSHA